MKKLYITIALAGALGALTAQAALQIDSWTRVAGYYAGNGGEFTLDPNAALAAKLKIGTYSDIASKPGTFESFCLEEGEFIHAPADVVINTKALYGGVGPAGDPLSKGTSWLYSEFRLGTLTGYDYLNLTIRKGDAGRLQNAIWALEGGTAASNEFTTLVTTHFGSWAAAIADAAAYENNVVALNLWKPGKVGSTVATDRWQDQLAMVPEPSTLIAGAMLLLPFGASTIRFLRRNRTA